MFEDILDNSAFWILGGGGVAMEVLGYIIGKRSGLGVLPLWEVLVLIIGTLVAAAAFSNK